MTIAQVELMCADVPITVYPSAKSKNAPGEKHQHEFKEMSKDEVERARDEYRKLYGEGLHKINLKIDN